MILLLLQSITVAVRNVGTTGEDLFDVTPGFVVLKAFLGKTCYPLLLI